MATNREQMIVQNLPLVAYVVGKMSDENGSSVIDREDAMAYGIEGLIHISEISWERVEDPRDYIKTGQTVKAKIIAIDKDRLSLSLKQMS